MCVIFVLYVGVLVAYYIIIYSLWSLLQETIDFLGSMDN